MLLLERKLFHIYVKLLYGEGASGSCLPFPDKEYITVTLVAPENKSNVYAFSVRLYRR